MRLFSQDDLSGDWLDEKAQGEYKGTTGWLGGMTLRHFANLDRRSLAMLHLLGKSLLLSPYIRRSKRSFENTFVENHPNLWSHIQDHGPFKEVLTNFTPHSGHRTTISATFFKSQTSNESVAHLLLATSITQVWPRSTWWFHTPNK